MERTASARIKMAAFCRSKRKAGTCESCHANSKTVGLGLGGGTCMGCQQNTSEAELWTKISTHGKPDPVKHLEMMNQMIRFMAGKNVKPASLVEEKWQSIAFAGH